MICNDTIVDYSYVYVVPLYIVQCCCAYLMYSRPGLDQRHNHYIHKNNPGHCK